MYKNFDAAISYISLHKTSGPMYVCLIHGFFTGIYGMWDKNIYIYTVNFETHSKF